MFYSNQILARKGPLGLVWIAAHLDRQLKRQQINNTSIPASVDTLLDPEVPLALRLSGQLLLGVVRIYARKVGYLQQDCSDALVKLRITLRPSDGVNLPPGSQTAPVAAITLIAPGHPAAARNGKVRNKRGVDAAAVAAHANQLVDEDGYVIGVEEFYWDQDVFLSAGGVEGGFGHLELNGGFELGGLAPSGSGPLSQDISGVFGMHSSQDQDEVFDMEDEEAAAVWDLDEVEVERLRAAPSQRQSQSGALLGLTPGSVGEGSVGKQAQTNSLDNSEHMQSPQPPSDMALSPAVLDPTSPTPAAATGHNGSSMGDIRGNPADLLPPTPGGSVSAGAAGVMYGDDSGSDEIVDGTALLPATPGVSARPGPAVSAEQQQQQQVEEEDGTKLSKPAASYGREQQGAVAALQGFKGTQGSSAYDMMDVDGELDTEQQQQQQESQEGQGGDGSSQPQQQHGQGVKVGGGNAPTKTFQRRSTCQQQHQSQQSQDAAAAATEAAVDAAPDAAPNAPVAAVATTKAAMQKRAAALVGQKRRVIIDGRIDAAAVPDSSPDGGKIAAGSKRRNSVVQKGQPSTELPAAQIRALLADRAPLLDRTRGRQMAWKRPRLHAAAAAGAVKSQIGITVAATGGTGSNSSTAENLATLLGDSAAAASGGGGVSAAAGLSLIGFGGIGGLCGSGGGSNLGIELPRELQELFVQAATGLNSAAGENGATATAAVAPTAALDEIGLAGNNAQDEAVLYGNMAVAAPIAGLSHMLGSVTRSSLSLSLTSTPYSAAAAAGGSSGAAGAAAAAASGGIASPFGTGSNQHGIDIAGSFSDRDGADCTPGYTPGSIKDIATKDGDAEHVLQPLNPADVAPINQQDAGTDAAGAFSPATADDFGQEVGFEEEYGREGSDKENPARSGSWGSKGAETPGSAGRLSGGWLKGNQEYSHLRMAWPADSEMLLEAEAAEGDAAGPHTGGFTSRSLLVMRHLQHAAAAGTAAATPASASRRRISAGLPPSMAAAGGKGMASSSKEGGTKLSFSGLVNGHSRLDACRWFYEVLVLEKKGLVKLDQKEPFGDITVTPRLAAMTQR